MLGKRIKKLAKKVKKGVGGGVDPDHARKELLKGEKYYEYSCRTKEEPARTGFFTVYVGEERERYVVPTRYLSHPLFKILLEKAYDEFGFEQRKGLVVPCTVSAFKQVVSAVERNNCKFDMGSILTELVQKS